MKLRLQEKIGYGFGDAASSMFWKLFSAYLTYFYTNVFGIAASSVGTMMLVTRTWDSAFDPFVGVLGDRTNTRWGKFRPYLLWVAIPFAIIGVLTFTTPSMSTTGKLIYAYVTYSLMMTIYSLINVPYAALMGVMTADSKERTALATFRFIFAFGGSLVVLAAAEPLANFFGGNGANPQRGWQFMAGVFAVAAMVLFLFTFLWTRERIKPVTEKTSLKDDLADLGKNGPWFILLGAGVATIFFNTIRDGVAVFYFKYSLGNDSAFTLFGLHFTWTSMYFVLGQAANIVGVVAAKSISDRIGKKKHISDGHVSGRDFQRRFLLAESRSSAAGVHPAVPRQHQCRHHLSAVVADVCGCGGLLRMEARPPVHGPGVFRLLDVAKIRLDHRQRAGRVASGILRL